jgi:hypothetical protein
VRQQRRKCLADTKPRRSEFEVNAAEFTRDEAPAEAWPRICVSGQCRGGAIPRARPVHLKEVMTLGPVRLTMHAGPHRGQSTREFGVVVAMSTAGWVGLGIVALVIWVALAFWPARVAGRKGHSFFGYFL